MTSGFKASGVDLDDIFAPYISGTKAAVTGFTVAGADLKDRFQKYTSGPKVAATGHNVAGVDLCNIFAGYVVVLTDHSIVNDFPVGGSSGIKVAASGKLQARNGDLYSDFAGEWLSITGTAEAANYQVRATQVAGDAVAGDSVGTWLALSADREWRIAVTGANPEKLATLTLEIRRGTGPVLDSCTIDLQANVV